MRRLPARRPLFEATLIADAARFAAFANLTDSANLANLAKIANLVVLTNLANRAQLVVLRGSRYFSFFRQPPISRRSPISPRYFTGRSEASRFDF